MKTAFTILLIFLMGLKLSAGEIVVKPNLTSVKVFWHGAQLKHTAKVKLEKGSSEIALTDLSSNIDRNSIVVSAKGEAVILSVAQRFDYLRAPQKSQLVKSLEDSLELLIEKLNTKSNEVEVLQLEAEMIMANKEIGSQQRGVSIAELQKMAKYFRKKLGEIKTQQLSLNGEIKKIQKEIDRINKQLAELNSKMNQPVNEVVVSVTAKSATTIDLELSYFIYDAGWNPVYDLRADKIDAPITIGYKANLWQKSGADWNEIEIILSTRNPVLSNTKPELYPWFIDFEKIALYNRGAQKSVAVAPTQEAALLEDKAETLAGYISIENKQLSVEFVPAIRYNIPSDGKEHTISIKDYSIDASFEYYAVPKLDNNAFLVAYLTDWNSYNLLPGQSHIYFENSLVGQSFINPFSSKDTLAVSFGRDQNIIVEKEVLRDFTEEKFLSSDIERVFAFDIKIRNNKNSKVKILVEEQIPISKNEEIEVKLIDASKADYNKETGKLKWFVDVEPGKTVVKKLVYSVRYPKDKVIPNL